MILASCAGESAVKIFHLLVSIGCVPSHDVRFQRRWCKKCAEIIKMQERKSAQAMSEEVGKKTGKKTVQEILDEMW